MPRKIKTEHSPLDPKIRAAGYDILERAFGEYGVKGGTSKDLRDLIEQEIIRKNPKLIDKPHIVLSIVRLLGHHFFEIVTGEQHTSSPKKHNLIAEKFLEESTKKYLINSKEKEDSF